MVKGLDCKLVVLSLAFQMAIVKAGGFPSGKSLKFGPSPMSLSSAISRC
jgi:hypothetical protein